MVSLSSLIIASHKYCCSGYLHLNILFLPRVAPKPHPIPVPALYQKYQKAIFSHSGASSPPALTGNATAETSPPFPQAQPYCKSGAEVSYFPPQPFLFFSHFM